MNYAAIKKHDIANGPGVRVSLFVSGCTHHCDGCFNPETWDFHYGSTYTTETEDELLEALAPDYIRGLSLLGGEPMEPAHQGGAAPPAPPFPSALSGEDNPGATAATTSSRISWPGQLVPGRSPRRCSPIWTCW